jgi:hypothetical protein
MRNKQRGVSFLVVFLVFVIVALAAVGGMKVFPAYSEYLSIKKAVNGIAASEGRTGNITEIRKAFDRRANIDNIETVTGADLDIGKDAGELVISFAYSKKIPLFANVSLLIDFAASNAPGGRTDKE